MQNVLTADTVKREPRGATLAQGLDGPPVIFIAVVMAIAGIFWFPLWFIAAEILRLWAPRGGMRWLASRGVPEYTDDKYAMWIGIGPMLLIALRVVIALDWIAPFLVFAGKSAPVSTNEFDTLVSLVLGVAIATALAGVMRTTGVPRILGILNFVAITALAVSVHRGAFGNPNALLVVPIVVPAYLFATIAIRWDRWLYRRAVRRMGGPENTDSGRWERN